MNTNSTVSFRKYITQPTSTKISYIWILTPILKLTPTPSTLVTFPPLVSTPPPSLPLQAVFALFPLQRQSRSNTSRSLSLTSEVSAIPDATDGEVCIWGIAMRLRATLEHEGTTTTVLGPPQSHLLISASADWTLRTCQDARTVQLFCKHTGHHGPVPAAPPSLNGSVVGGGDNRVSVYTTVNRW